MTITAAAPKYDRRQPSKGAYDAIVYIDGSSVIAETSAGATIKQTPSANSDSLNVVMAAIIAYLPANQNAKIFFSHGIYYYNSSISIPRGFRLIGVARYSDWCPSGGAIFTRLADVSVVIDGHCVEIEKIAFTGDAGYVQDYIKVSNTPTLKAYLKFLDLYFYQGNCYGINLQGAFWTEVSSIRAYRLLDYVIVSLTGTTVTQRISDVMTLEGDGLIYLVGSTCFTIDSCGTDYSANATKATILVSGSVGVISNLDLEGTIAEGFAQIGVWIAGGSAVTMNACRFRWCGSLADPYNTKQPIYVSDTSTLTLNNVVFTDTKSAYDIMLATATAKYIDNGTKWSNFSYRYMKNSGSSTGTGSEQTIAHGLAAIPTGCKAWIRYPISATVYAEKEIRMDATNIYPKVKTGLVYDWRVE